MVLTKKEKAEVAKRTLKNKLKAAKRFVNRNLWRAARIKVIGSNGRKEDQHLRRFQYCLKILESK